MAAKYPSRTLRPSVSQPSQSAWCDDDSPLACVINFPHSYPYFLKPGASVVGRGYHIALGREHAKRLFSLKEDQAILSFLEELKASPEIKKSGRLLDCGTAWDPIHRCLTEGELDPTGGDFPLNHAILGGKQLHKGAEQTAVLVRPDMTRFIADALEELTEDDIRRKFFALNPQSYQQPIDEKHFMQTWIALQTLKDFYLAATENLEAVVFTAKLVA